MCSQKHPCQAHFYTPYGMNTGMRTISSKATLRISRCNGVIWLNHCALRSAEEAVANLRSGQSHKSGNLSAFAVVFPECG